MKRFATILFALLSMSFAWAKDYNNIREDLRYVYLICNDGLLKVEDNKKVTICSRDAVSKDCYWVIDANNRIYSSKFGKELCLAKNLKLKKKGNVKFQNGHIVYANPAKGKYLKLFDNKKFVAKSIHFGENISSTSDSQRNELQQYLSAIKRQKQDLHNRAKNRYYDYRQNFISNILKGYNASYKSQAKVDDTKLWNERSTINAALSAAKYNNENRVNKGSTYTTWDGFGTLTEDLFYYSDGYYHYKNSYKSFTAADYLCFPNESYSQPYDSCIGAPTAKWHYKISRDYWVIDIIEQVQVDPTETVRSEYAAYQDKHVPEKPIEVRDLDKEAYDKNGWPAEHKAFKQGTYDTKITLWGWRIPVNITCSRKMWPTPRTNRMTHMGGVYAALGNDADPYCPWRVRQNLTIRIDLNKLSKQLGMSKHDLQASFLGRAISFGKGRLDRYALSAILYRLYGKSMTSTLNKKYETALAKKDYITALECAYHLELKNKVMEYCSQSFNECKDINALIDTFKKVAAILYPNTKNLDVNDLADVIFDGINTNKNTPYSNPSKLYGANNARGKYFKTFVNQRNKFIDEKNPFKSFASSSSPIDSKKFLDPTFHETFYSYKTTNNDKKLFANYANTCVEEGFVGLLNSPAKSLEFVNELDSLYSKGYLGSTHPRVRFANKYSGIIVRLFNERLCNEIEEFAEAIRCKNKLKASAEYSTLNETLKTIRDAENLLQIKIINENVKKLYNEYRNCYQSM